MAGELLTSSEILWKRLSGFYGYPFIRQYGATPTLEWEMAVDGLDTEAIGMGLKKMVVGGVHTKFPPNPVEFRALCLPVAQEPCHAVFQLEHYRAATPAVAERHLAQLRGML